MTNTRVQQLRRFQRIGTTGLESIVLATVVLIATIGYAENTADQATGIVFLDANRNGVREAAEIGLKGIRVSNGQEVVRTDSQGRYTLPLGDDTIIFVIKPRGFMTAIGENNLPRFYYIHKPQGSPSNLKYPGVAATGPAPASIDFPLYEQSEPDRFKVLVFGDTQTYTMQEIEWLARDIIEEVIGIDGAFGVSLGDLVGDDLALFHPLNAVIATVGIPWYNVHGNHDQNFLAEDDRYADETFERVYGPACYSFDWGPVHFITIDNVYHFRENTRSRYRGEIGSRQLTFIENDLAHVPEDQLIVLMMHIPLPQMTDLTELFELLDDRPYTFSLSAHTHVQRDDFIGVDHGWQGESPHHHHNHATASGSWWKGTPDEVGIPHTTMRDGTPNGYGVFSFEGNRYSIRFKAARRPADYQMNLWAPWEVDAESASETEVLANIFAGTLHSVVEMRFGDKGEWGPMERVQQNDPYFEMMKTVEAEGQVKEDLYQAIKELVLKETGAGESPNARSRRLPRAVESTHLWRAALPENPPKGTHVIFVRTTDMFGQTDTGRRIIRIR